MQLVSESTIQERASGEMSRKKLKLALMKQNIKSSLAGTRMLFLPGDKTRDKGASLLEFL